MTESNLHTRMDTLHSRTVYPLPPHLAREYEQLDTESCKYMELAEKKCRKFRMGGVPFSPTYQRAVATIEYWMRRLSYEQGTCRNVRQLMVLRNQADIPFERDLSILEILKRTHEARRERRRCKDTAVSLQVECHHDLAAAKEAAGNIKAAVHLRNMNRVEATRKMHQNIRYMEGKISAGATAQVTVTSRDGTITELTAKDEVEYAIINSNKRKYHQTEGGSELLSDALVQYLACYDRGPLVEQVLNGTYVPPPGTSAATTDFLQA